MMNAFTLTSRKALLTLAVSAAFISANPLLLHGGVFGGVAHASQKIIRHDNNHRAVIHPSSQAASASGSSQAETSVADNDMDSDDGLGGSGVKHKKTH